MKVLIDACVLYPTVMREIVLGAAAKKLFAPLWTARVLEEWARAAVKLGPAQEALARGEIAMLRANWPDAEVAVDPDLQAQIWLPDPDDVHVLAGAVSAGADLILTLNLRDFPTRLLTEYGLRAQHPDAFLRDLLNQDPDAIREVAEAVRQTAEQLSGVPQPMRQLLKKARLPRLGKALG